MNEYRFKNDKRYGHQIHVNKRSIRLIVTDEPDGSFPYHRYSKEMDWLKAKN